MTAERPARSHIVLRVLSVLAVGAVAVALLVGFFFSGDFGAAFRRLSGGRSLGFSSGIESAAVTVDGTARFDGTCRDAEIAEKTRQGARFNARTVAEDRCRSVEGAPERASIRLKQEDEVEPTLETIGSRCVGHVRQSFTCLYER